MGVAEAILKSGSGLRLRSALSTCVLSLQTGVEWGVISSWGTPIRSVDPENPIVLEGWFHASATGLGHLEPVHASAVLYAFHFYDPWIFTTYRINKGRFEFPGRMPALDSQEVMVWTPEHFAKRLQPVVEWSRRFEIPATRVIAAEFGCDRRVSGAREYLADLIAQLNAHKWHWAMRLTGVPLELF